MDDDASDVTLPTLPQDDSTSLPAPTQPALNSRKRPLLRSRGPSSYEEQLTDAITTSSDPAFFSSDDNPDAENYTGALKRRKKRIFEGTWWHNEPRNAHVPRKPLASGANAKRNFRRNFDSGIFMTDDSSGTELSSDSLLEQALLDGLDGEHVQKKGQEVETVNVPVKAEWTSGARHTLGSVQDAAPKQSSLSTLINSKDHLVEKVIQDCLDKNDENVDWTGLGLDSLPPAIVGLKSMIRRIPSKTTDASLAPFEAELKVYLGNNEFSQLPSPLLELTNIQLLSIRQNNLSELPPGIRSLTSLEELNLSSNNLRYLPFEVIRLIQHRKLKMIHSLPNPWLPVPGLQDGLLDIAPLKIATFNGSQLYRYAVSKPKEYLANGTSLQGSVELSNHIHARSKAAHLSEMVLRALSRHNPSKQDLSCYLSEPQHPHSAQRLLKTLYAAQTSGGRICTFCNRDIILPRYEWYEWWHCHYSITTGKPIARQTVQIGGPRQGHYVLAEESYIGPLPLTCIDTEIDQEQLIPFQRMACGCVDVMSGMLQEECDIRKYGILMSSLPSPMHN